MTAIADARRATPHDLIFLPLFVGILVVAWAALATWEISPYGHYLDHDWTRFGSAISLCTSIPAGENLVPALLYVGGWVLTTAAMMLPTTLPLVAIFRRLTAREANRRLLLAWLFGGYLSAWLAFGVATHIAGLALAWMVGQSPFLSFNGWIIGAAVLATAGIFQFSRLKYRCLDQCRSPFAFVMTRWTTERAQLAAARIGLGHGAYCVGCCWALMLLMFVVGTGSVGWMLALGAIMALEKNSPWGRRLATPLGAVLIVTAGIMTATNLVS